MTIASLRLEMIRATPAVAEFIVHVAVAGPVRDIDVRGRATGPHGAGAATVEVAYPLAAAAAAGSEIALRGVIPEPNLWTPTAPFLYTVTVELLAAGIPVDARAITIALRGR